MIYLTIVLTMVCCLTSCCRYDPKTKTMYGYGRYKDANEEMECKPLLSDLVNISGIKE